MTLKRRKLLISGAAVLGLGGVVYGGSLAVCRPQDQQAELVRSLFVVLDDIPDPEKVGRALLAQNGRQAVLRDIGRRFDLFELAWLQDRQSRRAALLDSFQEDFERGDTVVADRWIVSRGEALIAGAWVS